MKRVLALLVVGWVLTSMTRTGGYMPLREYRTETACIQVAANYNVEHIWDGPQGLLPLLSGEVTCEPDNSPAGYQAFPFGQWYRGEQEWTAIGSR